MASGEEKGCVLWTLMSIGLLLVAVVALCALAGCDHPRAGQDGPPVIHCSDGTASHARTSQGACSQHGGIA